MRLAYRRYYYNIKKYKMEEFFKKSVNFTKIIKFIIIFSLNCAYVTSLSYGYKNKKR